MFLYPNHEGFFRCPVGLTIIMTIVANAGHKVELFDTTFISAKENIDDAMREKGGLAISYAAAALGISSLERHFTLDRTMYGSDQAASIEPKTFKELIGGIRKIENAITGDHNKKLLQIEDAVAKKLRAHIAFKK